MSVLARLWRRAPAWRFCLVSAVACTGLAAMFPPALPPVRWPGMRAAGGHDARYRTADTPVPSGHGDALQAPLEPPPLHGSIRFAGRSLPLPSGTWRELMLIKGNGAEVPQAEILVRTTDPAAHAAPTLTGLVLATAPGPLTQAVGPVGLPSPCMTIGRDPGQITPTRPDQSPLAHECWVARPIDGARARADTRGPEALLGLALSRLDTLHVAVPAQTLAIEYVRTDETGWMNVEVALPDGAGRQRAVLAWAARFARPVYHGFEGPLGPADLTPAAVDDPR